MSIGYNDIVHITLEYPNIQNDQLDVFYHIYSKIHIYYTFFLKFNLPIYYRVKDSYKEIKTLYHNPKDIKQFYINSYISYYNFLGNSILNGFNYRNKFPNCLSSHLLFITTFIWSCLLITSNTYKFTFIPEPITRFAERTWSTSMSMLIQILLF